MTLLSATLESLTRIILHFDADASQLDIASITIAPGVRVLKVEALETIAVLTTVPLNLSHRHAVTVMHAGTVPLAYGRIWNAWISDKPLGAFCIDGGWAFRVFAPRASRVQLQLFSSLDAVDGDCYDLERDEAGVWEILVDRDLDRRYYCYRVSGPEGGDEGFDPSILIADPYGRAIVARNSHRQEARTLLFRDGADIDWQGDSPVRINPRDAVIYELHVKDMTQHPSSGVPAELAGTYLGLVHRAARGGISHLKRLGVNAVELLPCQHFAAFEPPYDVKTPEGWYNSWNPYEFNHWGYMTSWFLAPEPSYAMGEHGWPGHWHDTGLRHITEFKLMVRELHREGIAVIMDVVYNHTSHYNQQPLRHLDRKYYYRADERGFYTGASGCGNDLMTERPMARRLIIDSILHWMTEFHVDGFRFDLAALIDQATFIEIRDRARAINPDVLLIAEPWGGGMYDLARFSDIGMPAWNDVFRNSVKGFHPVGGLGFIFGSWGWNSPEAFGQWVLGSVRDKGGPFLDAAHAVNYLESHDGYTLGDFIRIATGTVGEHDVVTNIRRNARLTPQQLRLHRLAALLLLTCKGAVMIAEGQEWGRSKVIARRGIPGITPGLLDHDSYNKDDETNWLNYDHADINADLVDYHAGLIAIRHALPALRHAAHGHHRFLVPDTPVASGYVIDAASDGVEDVCVLVNPNPGAAATFTIPDGEWLVLADDEAASPAGLRRMPGGAVTVPPVAGVVAKRVS